jgi:hypothetical protein
LAAGVFSEDLVYRWAIEVVLCEGVVTVKDEGNVFTIVDVAFSADSPSSGTIRVDTFGNAAGAIAKVTIKTISNFWL